MKSKNLSENILKIIKSNGYKHIDLDTVIDTNLILERSGESFKRFIFSFNDQLGNELCLRPDLTIEYVTGFTDCCSSGKPFTPYKRWSGAINPKSEDIFTIVPPSLFLEMACP